MPPIVSPRRWISAPSVPQPMPCAPRWSLRPGSWRGRFWAFGGGRPLGPGGGGEGEGGGERAWGLIWLWVFDESGGPVYDAVRRRRETVISTSGWVINANGFALTARTVGDGIQLPASFEDLTANWTVLARIRRNTIPGGTAAIPIYSRWTNTTTQRQFYFYFRPSDVASPNQLQFDIPWIAAILTSNTAIADTTTVHAVGASRAGNTWTAWLDGGVGGRAPNATAPESAQTTSPWWGYGTFDNTSMAGDFTQTFVWRVAQPASHMLWLHTEPYAVLRPRVPRRYFVPAGVGLSIPIVYQRRRQMQMA